VHTSCASSDAANRLLWKPSSWLSNGAFHRRVLHMIIVAATTVHTVTSNDAPEFEQQTSMDVVNLDE
jgi:hypothetical protein